MNFHHLLFWRRPPIADLARLSQFIDEQAAFVAQKGIYEYSRARAGHYAKVLFSEPDFLDAVERARWRAYPLGLAMVGEVVEGTLCRHTDTDRPRMLQALEATVLAVFDDYAVPPAIGEADWQAARAELVRRLQHIGLHPPKRTFAIADPFISTYFNLMPIHKSLRESELPTLHSYLRLSLVNIHDELAKRMDAAALVAALTRTQGGTALPPAS